MKIQPNRKFNLILNFPLLWLFSMSHIAPLSATPFLPCALHRLYPPLPPLFPSSSLLQRDGHWGVTFLPPPLQNPHTVVVVVADDGESEIGRQKEIDFCLPPSQTLLTLTITITFTIPPLLLSPLQISAGRL